MISKKVKNRPDYRCEICEDRRISFISRLNQNDFLSFFLPYFYAKVSYFLVLIICTKTIALNKHFYGGDSDLTEGLSNVGESSCICS